MSDAFAVECTTRHLYDCYINPPLITQYDKTRIFSLLTRPEESPYWNRWFNYAVNVLPIFECTPGLEYARIALSVGIDTDSTYGNNRIGAIIVLITRPPKGWTYKTKLRFMMKQFEEKVSQNYKDCMTTYDVLRSYDASLIRKFVSANAVDIIFTSMYGPVEVNSFDIGFGAFIGNKYDYPYFYINSTTVKNICITGYTTNWKQFNHKKFVSDYGADLMYTFD